MIEILLFLFCLKINIHLLGQVKQEKELTKGLQLQVQDLTKKNLDLKSEIEGVRTASQLNTEERTQSIQAKHQQEIASLQLVYQG